MLHVASEAKGGWGLGLVDGGARVDGSLAPGSTASIASAVNCCSNLSVVSDPA